MWACVILVCFFYLFFLFSIPAKVAVCDVINQNKRREEEEEKKTVSHIKSSNLDRGGCLLTGLISTAPAGRVRYLSFLRFFFFVEALFLLLLFYSHSYPFRTLMLTCLPSGRRKIERQRRRERDSSSVIKNRVAPECPQQKCGAKKRAQNVTQRYTGYETVIKTFACEKQTFISRCTRRKGSDVSIGTKGRVQRIKVVIGTGPTYHTGSESIRAGCKKKPWLFSCFFLYFGVICFHSRCSLSGIALLSFIKSLRAPHTARGEGGGLSRKRQPRKHLRFLWAPKVRQFGTSVRLGQAGAR